VGHLVVSRTVDVVKNRARQPSPRQPPEIMTVVAVAEADGRLRSTAQHRPRSSQSGSAPCPLPWPCRCRSGQNHRASTWMASG
jgi:hypothetical protein